MSATPRWSLGLKRYGLRALPTVQSAERAFTSHPSLLQSVWWAEVKRRNGWQSHLVADASVLVRTFGPVTLAYLPHAWPDADLAGATGLLREVSARTAATLVRWDIPHPAAELSGLTHRDDRPGDINPLVPSPIRVQPPDTVAIDVSGGDEDSLLAAMKSKTRYNVRLAARKGVEVRIAGSSDASELLGQWYELYRETAERDRIAIHPHSYYAAVLGIGDRDGFSDTPRRDLYLAYWEGRPAAGIITASWGGVTTYLYGASASAARSVMAPYLLQWHAIRDARARGDRWYDLFGIPPSDDPAHPMHGLYRFKTGFGGEIIHRAGAWDLLEGQPLFARAYRGAERIRAWYYYTWRKRVGRR